MGYLVRVHWTLTYLKWVKLSSSLSHHLSQPKRLLGLWVYRNHDCGFVWFHNAQRHGGFYPLNVSTLLQITTNIPQITTSSYTTTKSPLASKSMINKVNIYMYISRYYKLLSAINNIVSTNSMAAINHSSNW